MKLLISLSLFCFLCVYSSLAQEDKTYSALVKKVNESLDENAPADTVLKYTAELISLNISEASIYRIMGSAFQMKNQDENAILAYNRALSLNPNDLNTLYNISVSHVRISEAAYKKMEEISKQKGGNSNEKAQRIKELLSVNLDGYCMAKYYLEKAYSQNKGLAAVNTLHYKVTDALGGHSCSAN